MSDFPGARWWRFDLHNHSPASSDYRGDKTMSARDWLLDYMRAGIDCVAVTDHNGGGWIDRLNEALAELRSEQPSTGGFRPLVLLPGVEITSAEEIHLLGIFVEGESAEVVTGVMARVDCPKTGANAERRCDKSAVDVIKEIHKAGGLAIAAHIDRKNGLYASQASTSASGVVVHKARLKPRNIAAIIGKLDAVEIVDESSASISSSLPALRKRLALVASSDAHAPAEIGRGNTWVKMPMPSLDGLRMAFLDPDGSVERFEPSLTERNRTPALWLRGLEVSNLRLRRSPLPGPLAVRFNPWFNAIIGGRGSGKSSLLELIRIVLRRENELRDAPNGPLTQIAESFGHFAKPADARGNGALLPETVVSADMRKDDAEYRISWEQAVGLSAVEELTAGNWQAVQEQIDDSFVRLRYPVTILSQKQIFALAEQRGFLLDLIDRTDDVGFAEWKRRYDETRQRIFAFRAQARQLTPELRNRPAVEAQFRDVKRKLAALELSHHAESLKQYQRAQAQLSVQRDLIAQWNRDLETVTQAAADADLFGRVEFQGFDPAVSDEAEFLALVDEVERGLRSDYQQIRDAVARLTTGVATLPAKFAALTLQTRIKESEKTYSELLTKLKAQGVESPDQYAILVTQQQTLTQQLKQLDDRLAEQNRIKAQAKTASDDLAALRREITGKRQAFIDRINSDAIDRVRLKLRPFGRAASAESGFRELIKQPEAFAADIFEKRVFRKSCG